MTNKKWKNQSTTTEIKVKVKQKIENNINNKNTKNDVIIHFSIPLSIFSWPLSLAEGEYPWITSYPWICNPSLLLY